MCSLAINVLTREDGTSIKRYLLYKAPAYVGPIIQYPALTQTSQTSPTTHYSHYENEPVPPTPRLFDGGCCKWNLLQMEEGRREAAMGLPVQKVHRVNPG